MPRVHCVRSVDIERTPRVQQLEGMFDVPPTKQSKQEWTVNLPIDDQPWNIGLLVGPSGCGKSTLARELWPKELVDGFKWPKQKSLVDAFPNTMSIKEITLLLSSVGFSSPPAWLRPFRVLSNGEQFRATVARSLAEAPELAVIDEFTSVVDRTVAQIGSAAIAKTVRRRDQKFVAVSCHYDIIDWLDPDWVYEPATDAFHWRSERRHRPPLRLTICRVHRKAWKIFSHHHYLNTKLSTSARCFVGTIADFETGFPRPAVFTAVLSFPHPYRPGWIEHRTVCLPDFQGVGIGNAMSAYVAGLFAATKPYFSTTSSPAMIRHRHRSDLWTMKRKPSHVSAAGHSSTHSKSKVNSRRRITAGFEYVGPKRLEDAKRFGLIS